MRALLAITLVATTAIAAPVRAPIALKAEETFFRALNHDVKLQKQALRELTAAYATNPRDGRTTVLLGLGHLWMAGEGSRTNPETLEHLYLSESFLARAQKLPPEDPRIPSWIVPARIAIAGVEGEPSRREQIMSELLTAYAEYPAFHSFTVALLGFDSPRGSESFERGRQALHSALNCVDDSACRNDPHWPHNVEAFRTFAADHELKAGNVAKAKAMLESVKAHSAYATFLFPDEVEDRLANLGQFAALYANDDPRDDPPSIVAGDRVCRACHATK